MQYQASLTIGLLLLAAPIRAEDDSPAERALAENTAKLESALKDADADVIARIEAVAESYRDAPAPQQKSAAAAVGTAARSANVRVRHAAFGALGTMRHRGSSKYLKRWLNPPKRKISESHLEAIRSAGQIADRSMLRHMRRLSDHKNTEVAVEATKALSGYKGLSVASRKQLAIELAKRAEKLGSSGGSRGWGRGAARSTTEEKPNENGGDPSGRRNGNEDAAERRASLLRATGEALRELTGEKFYSALEWGGWWRQAKKQRNPFG